MRKFHFFYDFNKSSKHDQILTQVVIEKFGCKVVKSDFSDNNGSKEVSRGVKCVEVVDKKTTPIEVQYLEKVLSLTMGQKIVFVYDD